MLDVLEAVAQVMFKFTGYVMLFAPIGVMAAIAATVGGKGPRDSVHARQAGAGDVLGLAIFVLVVVVGVALLIRVPIRARSSRAIREPFLIAFTTASSEAALPKALEVMERFGVPEEHRRLRAADRLQLQSRRDDAVSVARERVRRADGGRRDDASASRS